MYGGSCLAQRAQTLGDPVERIIVRFDRRQRLADQIHDVTGVGLVAEDATADEAADLLLSETVGDRHVLDEFPVHGGVQLGVAAHAAADIYTMGADEVVAEMVAYAIALACVSAHAVRLHRDRDDAGVLLRIGVIERVADDRVEARERLVDELLLHRITSTGRVVARGAGPFSSK